jgi:hypothetical protein
MKKHFLSLFIVVVLGSCNNPPPESAKDAGDIPEVESGKLFTITIEGCEYLSWRYDRSLGITHKGNCNNPIHFPLRTEQSYMRIDTIDKVFGESGNW